MVVKRPPEQRRKLLPPELEAFARSDDEKLRIRRPRTDQGRVRDPREGYIVAGVANRDARAVYDVRSEAMRALWADGEADEAALTQLGELLHDALRLELWRARRLTSFDAFAEEVIGIPAARAEELAQLHAARSGEASTPLTERAIALWLRAEAGLYEGDEGARARIRTRSGQQVLELEVVLTHASTALAGAGAKHLPLARTMHEGDGRRGEARGHEDAEDRGRGASAARSHSREHDRGEPHEPRFARRYGEDHDSLSGDPRERSEERPLHDEHELAEPHAARDALASARLAAPDDDAPFDETAAADSHPAEHDAGELDDESLDDLSDAAAPDADSEQVAADSEPPLDPTAMGERDVQGEPQREPPALVSARAAAHGSSSSTTGGARLLTRKHRERDQRDDRSSVARAEHGAAPTREGRDFGRERDGTRGFGRDTEPRSDRPAFGRREDRAGAPTPFGRRDDRDGKRPFGARSSGGGERGPGAERPHDRPRFGRGDEARGGFKRGDHSAGQRDDRPRFGNNNDRPRFGSGNDRPRFGNGNDRPRFGNGDRPRFGGQNERPRFGDERPRTGNDRPRFAGAERTRSQGGRDEGSRFGGNRGRQQGDGNDRPRFGGGARREDGPRFAGGQRGDRGRAERPRFGDRDQAAKTQGRGDDHARVGERRAFGGQGKQGAKGGHAGAGFGARKPLAPKQEAGREPREAPRPPRRDDEDDFE